MVIVESQEESVVPPVMSCMGQSMLPAGKAVRIVGMCPASKAVRIVDMCPASKAVRIVDMCPASKAVSIVDMRPASKAVSIVDMCPASCWQGYENSGHVVVYYIMWVSSIFKLLLTCPTARLLPGIDLWPYDAIDYRNV